MYDEKRLLKKLQNGDRCAFEELADHFGTRIYRLALRYADSIQDAEDLTQEVFVGIFRNIGGFRGASALSTWVYRVAVNHCLEYRRKRRLDCVPYEEELGIASVSRNEDPEQSAKMTELSAEVEKAIDKLSPVHRDVILLHELQGLTYGECAAILGVPVGTVKSRLSNAFSRMRQLMGSYVLEEA